MAKLERTIVCLAAAGALFALSGCMVPKGDYDAAVAKSKDLQARVYSLESSLAVANKDLADARKAHAAEKLALAGQRDKALADAKAARGERARMKARLDRETREFAALQAKLTALVERVDQLRAKVKAQPPAEPPPKTPPAAP